MGWLIQAWDRLAAHTLSRMPAAALVELVEGAVSRHLPLSALISRPKASIDLKREYGGDVGMRRHGSKCGPIWVYSCCVHDVHSSTQTVSLNP